MAADQIRKVVILGSGALKIGEAGEFDYSGSQAIKAFKEEGIETVLINPNIATIQTSAGLADRVYLLPVKPDFVERILVEEKPDAIFISCGGQTALNCGLALADAGVLEAHGVRILGTAIESVRDSEDRQRFADRMRAIGVDTPRSQAVSTLEDAVAVADEIGYPVMVRLAYALGGMGSGRCADRDELVGRIRQGLAHTSQILVEEYLQGWKEVEYEVMRDRTDNAVIVCNMENLDPLGIHTGESIVVAPSQTLDNEEYHRLREIGLRVFRELELVGEGNIQFALHPDGSEYRVIEVNPRLSRSSALASKATGYPIAYIATKLAIGHSLSALKNLVTGITAACFEPALDYIVVKCPRWDLDKFSLVSPEIGSGMKSVGEVMAIGRTFEEALQKALRMVDIGVQGLIENDPGEPGDAWHQPRPERIFNIARAVAGGVSLDEIHRRTHIHPWFLSAIERIVWIADKLSQSRNAPPLAKLLREAKECGFSDPQIAGFTGVTEADVRSWREELGLHPVIKQIDTLAGEYPASTNYLFLTYQGDESDVEPPSEEDRPIVILGAGPYRIGCSVEFDWCCVEATRSLRRHGRRTVIVNCNPETVSTDYDESERLYFDELSLESILEILRMENAAGVVVSVGGQVSNSLAGPLKAAGAPILGTDPDDIDRAEDRHVFSALLDEAGIHQPQWIEATSLEDVTAFCERVGFPVLVRPSYVLSGSAMAIATGPRELETYLERATDGFDRGSVVVSRFIEEGKEVELDGVAVNGEIASMTIAEHIENAGVHSGDATMVIPPQRIFTETERQIRRVGTEIAKRLRITGPFNVQFIARENDVRVIECNLRASRSLPFVSKVTGYPYIEAMVSAFLGEPLPEETVSYRDLSYVGVKAPQFSFSRLKGSDPRVGVEMASTGEVGCLGDDFDEAFLKAMMSVGYRAPLRSVFLSTGPIESKVKFMEGARSLAAAGVKIWATRGTARFLVDQGIEASPVGWPDEHDVSPNAAALIAAGELDLVVNIPKNNRRDELSNDVAIRRLAVEYGLPVITNIQLAARFAVAAADARVSDLAIKPVAAYYDD